jgi:L-ascorbate metabolism protein UlaG (beta-lactamase superfamily)
MFDIEYKGANSIIIRTKKTTLVIDPKLSLVGLKDVVIGESVELATEKQFAINSEGAKLSVEGPGEYGFGEFDVVGVAARRHIDDDSSELLSTMYRIEVGDVRIALLGNVNEKLSEEQLEGLGVVDILIIPVGGNGYTLDGTGAASLVRQISPKVVIPVHYADNGLKYEVPQDPIDVFVHELGAPVENTPKLKIKQASSLPTVLTVFQIERT